ncbi:MAG TPA: hypothetical protein VG452_04295 [Egibacteraceae bacterium]|nr:hypothetical protein [Egibacteraceae bacterium]
MEGVIIALVSANIAFTGLLATLVVRRGRRLDSMEARLDSMEAHPRDQREHRRRRTAHRRPQGRIDGLNGRIDCLNGRVDTVVTELVALSQRIARLERQQT